MNYKKKITGLLEKYLRFLATLLFGGYSRGKQQQQQKTLQMDGNPSSDPMTIFYFMCAR